MTSSSTKSQAVLSYTNCAQWFQSQHYLQGCNVFEFGRCSSWTSTARLLGAKCDSTIRVCKIQWESAVPWNSSLNWGDMCALDCPSDEGPPICVNSIWTNSCSVNSIWTSCRISSERCPRNRPTSRRFGREGGVVWPSVVVCDHVTHYNHERPLILLSPAESGTTWWRSEHGPLRHLLLVDMVEGENGEGVCRGDCRSTCCHVHEREPWLSKHKTRHTSHFGVGWRQPTILAR